MLGKISFSHVQREERPKTILFNNKIQEELSDYVAFIVTEKNIDDRYRLTKIPIAYDCKTDFCEGDIVEILPNGFLNIHYQTRSRHNQIFITSRCNSNCIMCPQPIKTHEEDRMDLNLKIIPLIDRNTEELALNGGEPTFVGENLFRIILACKHFLPSTTLLLLTNARKFNDFKYSHIFSSLKHPSIIISTSLYSNNEGEHDYIVGAKGAFDETISGILNLATFGHQIEIRIVLHKYTARNLLGISEFIYRNLPFTNHIAFMGLETIWKANKNLELLWVEPNDLVEQLEISIHYLKQRGMSVSIYNMPLCLLPIKLWSYSRQSISDWKNSFDEKCSMCSVRGWCAGLFNSGIITYKKYIKPITQ